MRVSRRKNAVIQSPCEDGLRKTFQHEKNYCEDLYNEYAPVTTCNRCKLQFHNNVCFARHTKKQCAGKVQQSILKDKRFKHLDPFSKDHSVQEKMVAKPMKIQRAQAGKDKDDEEDVNVSDDDTVRDDVGCVENEEVCDQQIDEKDMNEEDVESSPKGKKKRCSSKISNERKKFESADLQVKFKPRKNDEKGGKVVNLIDEKDKDGVEESEDKEIDLKFARGDFQV